MVDGLLMMYFTPPNRSIFVKKMRGTDHSKAVHQMEITEHGVRVDPKNQVLWESIE